MVGDKVWLLGDDAQGDKYKDKMLKRPNKEQHQRKDGYLETLGEGVSLTTRNTRDAETGSTWTQEYCITQAFKWSNKDIRENKQLLINLLFSFY